MRFVVLHLNILSRWKIELRRKKFWCMKKYGVRNGKLAVKKTMKMNEKQWKSICIYQIIKIWYKSNLGMCITYSRAPFLEIWKANVLAFVVLLSDWTNTSQIIWAPGSQRPFTQCMCHNVVKLFLKHFSILLWFHEYLFQIFIPNCMYNFS